MTAFVEVPFEVQEPARLRVDSWLSRRLHRYSRAQVQRLIAERKVLLRGRPVKAASKVAKGDTVIIRYPRSPEPPPAVHSLPIVFEDERLLAVAKPAGVLSHPTDKVVKNSVTAILKSQFPGLRLCLAHRLDRETSGLLLLAKDPAAARDLTGQFSGRTVKKEYLALAQGRIPWRRRIVDAPLGREGLAIKVRQKAGAGAPARTEFERLAVSEAFSLVRAVPRTGRLHQIRVHLAHTGHPVLGDKLYRGDGAAYMKAVRRELTAADIEALGAPRQMLHAWKITFRLPSSGRPASLTASIPVDFAGMLRAAGMELP